LRFPSVFHCTIPSFQESLNNQWESVQRLAMFILLMAVFQQLHSTLLTLFSSIFQLAALLWYLVSYFPMGSTGLQFMGRIGAQRVTAWVSSWAACGRKLLRFK
jgi:hypothetical protein